MTHAVFGMHVYGGHIQDNIRHHSNVRTHVRLALAGPSIQKSASAKASLTEDRTTAAGEKAQQHTGGDSGQRRQ
jgi:hypothetical protein